MVYKKKTANRQKRKQLTRNKLRKGSNKKQRRTNKYKNRLRKRQNKSRKNLKGGAIPFSEYGLAYDNLKYGLDHIKNLLVEPPPTVLNNQNTPVNPNPTSQFNRTTGIDNKLNGPNLGLLFREHYS
jgi:hypothetical protein